MLLFPRRASLTLAPLPVKIVGADALIGPLSVLVSGRSGDRPLRTSLRGESKEGPQPLFVSFQNRESQGRGRNRNLPLPCVVSLSTSLWTSKEKLNSQLASLNQSGFKRMLSEPRDLRSYRRGA